MVRPSTALFRLQALQDKLDFHQADIADAAAVQAVVRAVKPHWVFHLAVSGAYSWQTDALQMVQTNIVGTANLLEAAAALGFDAFVNTGSSSEYGLKAFAPLESESLVPNSYYSLTKGSATAYCRYVAQTKGLHVPTLRLYSAYGPWEEPKRFMPTLVLKALEGRLPPLVNPNIARDFVYIDDMIEAFLLAAAKPTQEAGAVYNVGSGQQFTIADIVAAIQELLPVQDTPSWGSMGDRKWDTDVWVANNEKIVAELNWRPRVDIKAGLTRTIKWFQDNPEIVQRYRQEQLLPA
jgi:dolichol-phosphate mannosyltransferase